MAPLVTNEEAFRIGAAFAWVIAGMVLPFACVALLVVGVLMPATIGAVVLIRGIGRLLTGWPFREETKAVPPGPPLGGTT